MDAEQGFAPTTLGRRLRERDQGWFCVTEAVHRPEDYLRPHAHRYPAITLVRQGSFGLEIGRDRFECSDRGVFYKLGQQRHCNRVGSQGSQSLIVALRSDHPRIEEQGLPLPRSSRWSGAPFAFHLAARIEQEFRTGDLASPLALEGLVLELVASLLRGSQDLPAGAAPPWLAEVEALLRARFRETIGLREVATAVQRHPVHVARMFRRHYRCSPGEYVRGLRLRHAARELRETDRSVCDIAVDAGFYDQAHFCRSFKRQAGLSPSKYRAATRA